MDFKNYLSRINYTGKISSTKEMLFDLQMTHLLSVPFENLDIWNGIKIDLYNSYDKVVTRNRGGFCYELNGLFYHLLLDLGYQVTLASARVFNSKNESYGPEFDHMLIIAKILDEEYIVDVGFGDFSLRPLLFKTNIDLPDPAGIFRLSKEDDEFFIVSKKNESGYQPEYKFSIQPRRMEDFFGMCSYHQTSPQSHFTQNRICSVATKEGRVTLSGNTLKITKYGKVTENPGLTESDFQQLLKEHFNIVV